MEVQVAFYRHVLDVEANVVAGDSLGQGLVVHLDGLDLSGEVDRGEGDNHAGLDHSSLHTTDGHCANASNFVDILKGSLRGLSVGLLGGMIESRASRRVMPLALPSFLSTFQPLYQPMLVEASIMLSPCHPEMGTKATAAGL